MSGVVLRAALIALVFVLAAPDASTQQRILFIKGGAGTGGFLEGGSDEHLSDIDNLATFGGNHGFGELKQVLQAEGFLVEQVVEGPVTNNTPVDLAAVGLDDYSVVVFGSNNAAYDADAVALLTEWVCRGGAALFVSDANWGGDWGDAPSSDQPFLVPFDLVMNQDTATYVLERSTGDFVVGGVDMGGHPILAGPDEVLGTADDVDAFMGEGVSPITVVDALPNVDPIVLAGAENTIHVNDSFGSGSFQAPTDADGALVALEYGVGRVAGHFDRNTFFNLNGAGTDIHEHDNRQYARNLFGWLADAPGLSYGTGCVGPGGFVATLDLAGCPCLGSDVTLEVTDAPGGSTLFVQFGLERADLQLPNGCPLLIAPLLPAQIVLPLPGAGPGEGDLSLPLSIPATLQPATITMQAFFPNGALAGGVGATNALEIRLF